MRDRLHGLYVITDGTTGTCALGGKVEAALRGGAGVVQYRDKSNDAKRRLEEAGHLLRLCRVARVPFIVNDDVELAQAVGADGVHLGSEDGAVDTARARLGRQALIGVSCYNRYEHAATAARDGADYIAFGSFFASPTKPRAVRAERDLLRRARSELALPVVAIGGISPENGARLVGAGADMLAVVSAVFAAPDITAAALAFRPCFKPIEGPNA